MKRKCAAVGCREQVDKRLMMCRPHWDMLDDEIRFEVQKSWLGKSRNQIAYLTAAKRAILFIKNIESAKDAYNKLISMGAK